LLIDEDDDGEWDYEYNIATGISTAYQSAAQPDKEEGFPWFIIAIIIIGIIIAVIVVLFKLEYIYFE